MIALFTRFTARPLLAVLLWTAATAALPYIRDAVQDDASNTYDLTKHGWSAELYSDAESRYDVSWAWDNENRNDGDGCALLDCDGNALADYAICVAFDQDNGQKRILSRDVIECEDSHAFRCVPKNKKRVVAPLGAKVDADQAAARRKRGPFSCDPGFYQVISGQLNEFAPATDYYNPIGGNGPSFNGVGYRVSDGYLYGAQNNKLIRIHGDGDIDVLTDLPHTGYTGDFGDDGLLHLSRGGSEWIKINVDTGAYTSVPELSGNWGVADIANVNGKFYGLNSARELIVFDPLQPGVFKIGLVSGIPNTGAFGAAWSTAGGNLYVGQNSGAIYQVAGYTSSSPWAAQIATAQSTNSNDGAACPYAIPPPGLRDIDGPESESTPSTPEGEAAATAWVNQYTEQQEAATALERLKLCKIYETDDPFDAQDKDLEILCKIPKEELNDEQCTLLSACTFSNNDPNSQFEDCVADTENDVGLFAATFAIETSGGSLPDDVVFYVNVDGAQVGQVWIREGLGISNYFQLPIGTHTFTFTAMSGADYEVVDITCDNGSPTPTQGHTFVTLLYQIQTCHVELACDSGCLADEDGPPVLESWPFYAIDDANKELTADQLLKQLDLRDVLPKTIQGVDDALVDIVDAGQADELLAVSSSAIAAERFELREPGSGRLLGGVEISKGSKITEHSLSVCTRFTGGRLLRVQEAVRGQVQVAEGVIELDGQRSAMRVNHIVLELHTDRLKVLSSWTPQSYAIDESASFVGVVVVQLWTPLAYGAFHTAILAQIVDHWRSGVMAQDVAVDMTAIAVPDAVSLLDRTVSGDVARNGKRDGMDVEPRVIGTFPPASRVASVHFESIDFVFPSSVAIALSAWQVVPVTVTGRCWEAASTDREPVPIQFNVPVTAFHTVSESSTDTKMTYLGGRPYRAVVVVELPQCADVVFDVTDDVMGDQVFTNLGFAYAFASADSAAGMFTTADRRVNVDTWESAKKADIVVPETTFVDRVLVRGQLADARAAALDLVARRSMGSFALSGNTALSLKGTFQRDEIVGVARGLVTRANQGVDLSRMSAIELFIRREGSSPVTVYVQLESGAAENAPQRTVRGADIVMPTTADSDCVQRIVVQLDPARFRDTRIFSLDDDTPSADLASSEDVMSFVHTIAIVFSGEDGSRYDLTVEDIRLVSVGARPGTDSTYAERLCPPFDRDPVEGDDSSSLVISWLLLLVGACVH